MYSYDSHHPSAFDEPLNKYRMAALNVIAHKALIQMGESLSSGLVPSVNCDNATALYHDILTHTTA